jgi:hypothetical protein
MVTIEKYNNWVIFHNAILDHIESSDCNNTVSGVCYRNQDVYGCIDRCKGDCDIGIFIKLPDNRGACLPLRAAIYPHMNSVYRIREQTIYDFSGAQTSVFINSDRIDFPVGLSNTVLNLDIVSILNPSTGLIIGNKLEEGKEITAGDKIRVDKGTDSNVQLILERETALPVEQYFSITFDASFNIGIPGTILIASTDKNNNLIWSAVPESLPDIYFKIQSLDGEHGSGDYIPYNRDIILTYGPKSGIVYFENGSNIMKVDFNRNLDQIKNDRSIHYKFQLISKMGGFYCSNKDQCSEIPLDRSISDSNQAYFGESKTKIYRHPDCWFKC